MKLRIQSLSCTSFTSGAQQPHVSSGYHIGQHSHRTFLSLQNVLLDIATVESRQFKASGLGVLLWQASFHPK